MIKAKLSGGEVVFGLSAKNLELLRAGRPIIFDGRPFGFPNDVIIMYGETEGAITAELLAATGAVPT